MSDAVSGTVLRDILAGCEGVTPGPWERRADPSHYDSVTDIYAQGFIIAQTCGKSFDGMEARAAHIARLDPQTIASIVSELIARREADVWQPIETAPQNQKVLVAYRNPLGNWRVVTACFHTQLEWSDDEWGAHDEPYAPAAWYEESDSHEVILPTASPPTHWRPINPPLSTNEPKP